jgi:hypothetical protein
MVGRVVLTAGWVMYVVQLLCPLTTGKTKLMVFSVERLWHTLQPADKAL